MEKKIIGQQIMFTGETKIDLSPFNRESIRTEKWDVNVYNLITLQEKKFEPSLMEADGISNYILSHLFVLDGTLKEFAFGHALLYFKEDIEKNEKGYKTNIFFEQDGLKPIQLKQIKNY